MSNFLSQIQFAMPGERHIEGDAKTLFPSDDASDWAAAGRPHVWRSMEKSGNAEAWLDSAHAMLALTVDGKLAGFGKNIVTHPSVVLTDVDYFGLPKWLWR